MPSHNARIWIAALLAILLTTFALRMVRVGDLLMWGDEGFSVYSANRDLVSISFESKDVDPHPPLYYYLFHFYLPLAGFSELSIRYFSIFFGTATVAVVYVLGRRLFDARAGILAALVAAVSPFGIQYSQEVRMYSLVMFLGAVTLWFFVRLVDLEWSSGRVLSASSAQPSSRRLWLGFFVSMFLTQYSLYQSAFVFVAQGVFLLPFLSRRFSFVLRWLAASLTIVLLFLPWLLTHSTSALADVQDVAGNTVPMNVLAFLWRGLAAISVGPTVPLSDGMTLAALTAALIVIGLVLVVVTHAATRHDWLLVAFVVAPMASLYPIYYVAPLYRGRLFAVAFVPLVLLIARSAASITSRARLAVVPVALLIAGTSVYSLNSYYFQYNRYSASVEDYIPAIHEIEQRAQPGDEVLFLAYWQEGYFLSHYHGAPLKYGSLDQQPDLDAAVAQPRNIWAIVQALPYHGAERWLAQNAFPLGEEQFGLMRVLRYRAGTPDGGEAFSAPIAFDNGMQLLGYRIGRAPVESGSGLVYVELDWQASHKIDGDYTIGVRLASPQNGLVWARSDGAPAAGTLPTSGWEPGQAIQDRHVVAVPVGTPPGSYTIQVALSSRILRPANNVALTGSAGIWYSSGPVITVARPARPMLPPVMTQTVDATWNEIALAGYRLSVDSVAIGDSLPLDLYWRALQDPTHDYAVWVQLVDAAGVAHTPLLERPTGDSFLVTNWKAGDIWLCKLQLKVDANSAPGDAVVLVALVDEQSGASVPPQTTLPTRDVSANLDTGPTTRVPAVELLHVKIDKPAN